MIARRLPLLAGVVVVLAIAAPASAATEQVEMADNTFNPSSVTIEAGDTVQWTNEGSNPHTVTGDGFDSGTVAPGDDYSHTFTAAGTFDYVCDFHPGMDGTVVVRAAAATAGDVDAGDEDDAGTGRLARTAPSHTGIQTGVAVAMVALGVWLFDLERIRSARHRGR